MPLCAAKECKNRTSVKSIAQGKIEETTKISFHSFPKNQIQRQSWLDAMGLVESIHKPLFLCSLHFKSEDFDRTSLSCVRLKSDAVPCVETECGKPVIGNLLNNEVEEKIKRDMSQPRIESERTAESSNSAYVQTLSEFREMETQTTIVQYADKSTTVTLNQKFKSPVEESLRNEIISLKRNYQYQIKLLRQKDVRKKKEITRLKTLLQIIQKKSVMADEQLRTLKTLDNYNTQLCKRIEKNTREQSMERMYLTELRSFVLMLHCYCRRE